MRRNPIGRGGVAVTELSFGGAQLGNLHTAISDATADTAVDAAWEAGIRYFDTAPHYGLGLSESRLGRALRDRPRDRYVVSTKVGRLLVRDEDGAGRRDDQGFDVGASYRREWDFSRSGVLRSVEDSLARLGLDRIDILLLHDPDEHWAPAVEQGVPALAQLRDEGVVGAIGAGMNQSAMLARFVRHADIDVVMLAGRYTLLEQGALDELLPLCVDRGVAVIAAGVFNSGLLARTRADAASKYNYGEAPPDLVDHANRIASVCARHGTSLPAAALRFPLAHPAVVSVNVGCRDAEQVRRNSGLFASPLPRGLWDELRAEGLLRADAPSPAAEDGFAR